MSSDSARSSRAQILSPTLENLRLAANALRRGELVAMPTETVYGLAGDAFQPEALARIFAAKDRPTFDPLIIHVADGDLRQLEALEAARLIDLTGFSALAMDRAQALLSFFWPGPLTLVLPKSEAVPDLATSGLPSVALRMPKHPVAQALLKEAATPLAAPSANRFGRISPTSASHVLEELGDRIHWILDGGDCEIGVESTVVSLASDGAVTLLRPGGISAAEIESRIGAPVQIGSVSSSKPGIGETEAAVAPGMLESHYAPAKSLALLSGPISDLHSIDELPASVRDALKVNSNQTLGVLVMQGEAQEIERKLGIRLGLPIVVRSLSRTGNLLEISQNLFRALREMDHGPAELLVAEPCFTQEGLGHAISDRLRRASAKRS